MGAILRSGARVVEDGDSNMSADAVDWPHPGLSKNFDPASVEGPGLITGINGQLTAPRYGRPGNNSGRRAVNTGRPAMSIPTGGLPVVEINASVHGSVMATIDAEFATRIAANNPSIVVTMPGLDDCGDPPTNITAFTASATSYATKLAALHIPVIWVGIAVVGSQWTPGPPLAWTNGVFDAHIDAVNAVCATICATFGFSYVPIREALLTLMPTINPTNSQTALTYDTIHLNKFAQTFVSNAALAQCVIIP